MSKNNSRFPFFTFFVVAVSLTLLLRFPPDANAIELKNRTHYPTSVVVQDQQNRSRIERFDLRKSESKKLNITGRMSRVQVSEKGSRRMRLDVAVPSAYKYEIRQQGTHWELKRQSP